MPALSPGSAFMPGRRGRGAAAVLGARGSGLLIPVFLPPWCGAVLLMPFPCPPQLTVSGLAIARIAPLKAATSLVKLASLTFHYLHV